MQTHIQAQSENLIAVQGLAQFEYGDYQNISKENSRGPLSFSEIIAVAGKVKSNKLNATISIKEIHRPKHNTSTNKDGRFIFHLKPGIYTFFIIKKDKAYLNRFDGYGYFKSTTVDMPMSNLNLIDDEESLN